MRRNFTAVLLLAGLFGGLSGVVGGAGHWQAGGGPGKFAAAMLKSALVFAFCAAVLAGLPAAVPADPQRPPLPLLPWHRPVVDQGGKLLPWYRPGAGLGYDRVLRLGWSFLEHNVPIDRKAGVKTYLAYAVFDGDSVQGAYWQHNPAFLDASLVDSLLGWYPYSGDRRAIALVRSMLDYELVRGTTPRGWAWARVPVATSCAGERFHGRCLADAPRGFYGGIEPDKVGLLGLGYLRFFELTRQPRFLWAGLAAANAVAANVRPGNASQTPWPFRVNGRTGATIGGAEYGGAVVGPIRLLDEAIRLHVGNIAAYQKARDLAWTWLQEQPLNPSSPAFNRWSGFYEDVPYNPGSRDQMSPTLTAQYLLEHESDDSTAGDLLAWVRATFGRGPFLGAVGIDEQRAPGKPGCCSTAGLGSDTSRWAAINALLYAQTGDADAHEAATRSLAYATYFARDDGRVSCCGVRGQNTYWFSDGYGDYLRSFTWAMAAMPELAPRGQDHLLGSTSVVQFVAYDRGRVRYRTFDAAGTETLRLSFRPTSVFGAASFDAQPVGGGDFVVQITRTGSRNVVIKDSRLE